MSRSRNAKTAGPSASTTGPTRRVFRNLTYPIIGWFLVVGGAVLAVLAALIGGAYALVLGIVLGTLMVAAGWLVYIRPRVVAEDSGVTVINPTRTVSIAWNQIARFDAHYRLSVITRGKSRPPIRAWAVQAANAARMFGKTSHADRVAADLNAMLARQRRGTAPAVTADSPRARTRMQWIAVGYAVAVVLLVLAWIASPLS